MTTRNKASPRQLAFMMDFMRDHPIIASGQSGTGLYGRVKMAKLWEELAQRLHALGGPPKSISKWKQTWRDLRNSYKKRAIQNQSFPPPATDSSSSNIAQTVQSTNTLDDQVWVKLECMPVGEMEEVPITEPAPELSEEDVLLVPDTSGGRGSESATPEQGSPSTPNSPKPVLLSARSVPTVPGHSPPKKRKIINCKRLDNFDERILRLEEEKLLIKKAHYAALEVTEERKAAALHR